MSGNLWRGKFYGEMINVILRGFEIIEVFVG